MIKEARTNSVPFIELAAAEREVFSRYKSLKVLSPELNFSWSYWSGKTGQLNAFSHTDLSPRFLLLFFSWKVLIVQMNNPQTTPRAFSFAFWQGAGESLVQRFINTFSKICFLCFYYISLDVIICLCYFVCLLLHPKGGCLFSHLSRMSLCC